MKYVAVVAMLLLGLAALLIPPSEPVGFDPEPGTVSPPISICPIVEAGGRSTRLSVLSSINGRGRVSSFAAGDETGAKEFQTGTSGAVTVAAAETAAGGVTGGLVEMPSESSAAGSTILGGGSLSAESCADIPTGQSFLTGGSTASGASFEVQLLNPYAGEAVVDLTVTTDAGIESDERFDAVIVPPLSTIRIDMTQVIPGRETISVNLETSRGSMLAVGRQTTDGETAIWRAVEPGQDWWLPIPPGAGRKQLLIATPAAGDVEYQIDYYGPDGFTEAYSTDILQPRGEARIGLAAITEEAAGVRVISTGPIVPTLLVDSGAGMARTTGSQVDAPVWLLPGASLPPGGSGNIIVLNTGLDAVTVSVRSLRPRSITRDFGVAAEGVLVVDLVSADGYRIESTGPVVALWTSQLDGAGSAAIGIPLQDE